MWSSYFLIIFLATTPQSLGIAG